MSLTEIQQLIQAKNLTPKLLEKPMMKQITWADQWIGYDDDETMAMKKAWADNFCFGGTMAWSVDFYPFATNGEAPPTTIDGRCGGSPSLRSAEMILENAGRPTKVHHNICHRVST